MENRQELDSKPKKRHLVKLRTSETHPIVWGCLLLALGDNYAALGLALRCLANLA